MAMHLTEEEAAVVYHGSRGEDFKETLMKVVSLSSLNKKLYSKIFDEESMELWATAFTAPDADPENNYEWAEFIGDSIANHATVHHIEKRFPQFGNDPAAVRVATRIKINTVSKATFCECARSIGFWPYISATVGERANKMRPLLEDSWEAFLGTFSTLVDRKCRRRDSSGKVQLGGGFQFCYEIVSAVLDKVPICGSLPDEHGVQHGKLKYEELVDAITRLKELFDKHKDLGKVKYECRRPSREHDGGDTRCHVEVYANGGSGNMRGSLLLGRGVAALQADAKQIAAKAALKKLRSQGFHREMRPAYAKFCE